MIEPILNEVDDLLESDLKHEGICHLFILPKDEEGRQFLAGQFIDISRRKSYAINGIDITSSKIPSCCTPEKSWYLFKVYNHQSGRCIKLELSSNSGDLLNFDSRYIKFQTKLICSSTKALEDAKKLINSSIKQFDDNKFVEEAIECIGNMSIYEIDLDELEEDKLL